jgi:hypothetical protein
MLALGGVLLVPGEHLPRFSEDSCTGAYAPGFDPSRTVERSPYPYPDTVHFLLQSFQSLSSGIGSAYLEFGCIVSAGSIA